MVRPEIVAHIGSNAAVLRDFDCHVQMIERQRKARAFGAG
jgi:hypothetical protein